MPYVVDLLPPSEETETAAALCLALNERKSKGLFNRKQYEPIEVLTRFALPLRTITWSPGATGGRAMIFDPQGLVTGNIQFALGATVPQAEFEEGAGEEAFLATCQQLTREATDFAPVTVSIVGLITQPEQGAPLLDGEDETFLAGLEQTAAPEEAMADLAARLEAYQTAAAAWGKFKEKVYSQRDTLVAKIQDYMSEDKKAGEKSLADLTSQVETAIAAKRFETDTALVDAGEEFGKRRAMLVAELERFQEGYKETPDNYWRDQIKTAEKALSEQEKSQVKKNNEIEGAFREFEKQQKAKIQEHKTELTKHLASFETRLQRLDTAIDGFSKGYERRVAAYDQQKERVLAVTFEISGERVEKEHNAVFYAARYPGRRWKVLPPQVVGGKGILGTVSGLFGGLNLPFKPATKLAETLATILEKKLAGSDLETRLDEGNLMAQADFMAKAKAGLTRLIDQGKLDKKHANLFAQLAPVGEDPAREEPAPSPEEPDSTEPADAVEIVEEPEDTAAETPPEEQQ